MKPTLVKNDVDQRSNLSSKGWQIFSERYKTRVMSLSSNQVIVTRHTLFECFAHIFSQKLVIEFRGATGEKFKVPARVVENHGRMTIVDPQASCSGKKILSVRTIGRQGLTNAESQRKSIILTALQTKPTFLDSLLAQQIWLSSPPYRRTSTAVSQLSFPYRPLNKSQRKAVESILSSDEMTIIHGPPGTGKTTVIAAAVNSIANSTDCGCALWLVAQSNVAVKNMAQKLGETGFRDFKLLISHEFYVDWCGTLFLFFNNIFI
jgi:hypothetical protein